MKNLLMLAAILVGVGCGKPDVVINDGKGNTLVTDRNGNVTVTDDKGNKTEVKSDGSSTSMKDGKGNEWQADSNGMAGKDEKGNTFATGAKAGVTEADLGVAFYPGSTEHPAGSLKTEADDFRTIMSMRKTTDTPAKVMAFYKSLVTEPKHYETTSDGNSIAGVSGKLSDGGELTLSASKSSSEPETMITIAVKRKK